MIAFAFWKLIYSVFERSHHFGYFKWIYLNSLLANVIKFLIKNKYMRVIYDESD